MKWILLFACFVALLEAKKPMFSWDTVPLFQQLCTVNATLDQPFSDARAAWVAKNFPLVVIEHCQGQGPEAYFQSGPEPYTPTKGYIEPHQKAAAAFLKKFNPNVTVINYQNVHATVPYFNFSQAVGESAHPDWRLKGCYSTGGNMFNKLHTYEWDLSIPGVQQHWIDQFLIMTKDSPLDGTFVDVATCQTTPPVEGERGDGLSNQADFAFKMLEKVQAANPDAILSYNTGNTTVNIQSQQVYGFTGETKWVEWLGEAHANHKITLAHTNDKDPLLALAAFLCGANEQQYFAWSLGTAHTSKNSGWKFCDPESDAAPVRPTWCSGMGWIPEYGYPLGAPLGPAVRDQNKFTRSFSTGTNVTFNGKKGICTINWSNGKTSTCA